MESVSPPAPLSEQVQQLQAQVADLSSRLALSTPVTARIPRYCSVGEGGAIAPQVTIWAASDARVVIGENVKITRGTEILGPVTIGSRSFINRDCYVRPGTTIGSDVSIGPFTRFLTDGHAIGASARRAGRHVTRPIKVGDGTWIGGAVTILGGVTIGRGCVISSGAVVARDVPDNTLVEAAPAHVAHSLAVAAPSGGEPDDQGLRVSEQLASIDVRARLNSHFVPDELAGLKFLRSLLGPMDYIGPAGGWAMSYAALATVMDFLTERSDPKIVELGGGVSTLWFAMFVQRFGGQVISIEENPEFLEVTRRRLEEHGLLDHVDLIAAPLDGAEPDQWYDRSKLPQLKDVDLLLVDGPIASNSPLIRRHALPYFAPMLAEGSLVVLDDTDRADESSIAERWQDDFYLEPYASQVEGTSFFLDRAPSSS